MKEAISKHFSQMIKPGVPTKQNLEAIIQAQTHRSDIRSKI